MMTFSKTDKSLTVVIVENGKTVVLPPVTSTHPRWNQILVALKMEDQEQLVELMSIAKTVERYTEANVVIEDGNVFFKGRQLHGLDVTRLLEYVRDGVPTIRLLRFLEKKQTNPSYRSINELYKFLEHREMTLTERGTVIGYKGVRDDYYSIMGNTATIMISGETDSGGHILNKIGADIRCERSCVCDDYQQGCSPGLHIGSLAYAKGWGPRVLLVEFDPADVVSVPDDCECQKLRACAYKVIGEYTDTVSATSTQSQSVEPSSDYVDRDGAGEDESTCDCDECNCDDGVDYEDGDDYDADYNKGYETGLKDGKAHKAREYYATDQDDESISESARTYIEGYNDGYRMGRYGK
jgi:hypothetical protein